METADSRPYSISSAAVYLGISESYLYKLTSQRLIRHFKSAGGKRVYFHKGDLDAWAFGQRVRTAQDIETEAANRVALAS